MQWDRLGLYVQCGGIGYRVSASKTADGWRYAAWTPEDEPWRKYRDRHADHACEHARRGTVLVQRSRCLGVYDTAEEARAACEAHAAAKSEKEEEELWRE